MQLLRLYGGEMLLPEAPPEYRFEWLFRDELKLFIEDDAAVELPYGFMLFMDRELLGLLMGPWRPMDDAVELNDDP